MTEKLLQFIWQFQYFNRHQLQLHTGESFEIIHPGMLNTNQGPDFLAGRIRLNQATIVGPIELHLKTSDWYRHAHQHDPNYSKVILHVVWENDMENVINMIPVFTLGERVSKLLLLQYEQWMNSQWFVPCEQQLTSVAAITWLAWKERLLVERLQRKSAIVFEYLEQNKQHWDQTFWWMLARNFGIKVNEEAFETVARSIPLNIIAKKKNQLMQLEALLLGQAGLLKEDAEEQYAKALYTEYHFQQKAYNLQQLAPPILFLRMRPASFPTVRLAQLAILLHQSNHLFSKIRETISVKDVKAMLDVTAGSWWDTHYTLDKVSPAKPKRLGAAMINNIIINTVVPVLFAWGHHRQEQVYKDRALQWLLEIAAEENHITEGFERHGIKNNNAFDSQAMIELKNMYCNQKRCLDCAVGNALLKLSN